MPANLETRIAALEAAKRPAPPATRPVITKEEAEAAYAEMVAPGPERQDPVDGLTTFERYMRMLNG
jgi:hypothetical protein